MLCCRKLLYFMFVLTAVSVSVFCANNAYADVKFITNRGDNEFTGSSTDSYSNKCPSNYVTCKSPEIGVGTACENKYASCKCPDEYNKVCDTETLSGGDVCKGKYKECKCHDKFQLTECSYGGTLYGPKCDEKYQFCTCPDNWISKCVNPLVPSSNTCKAERVADDGTIGVSEPYFDACVCPAIYKECEWGGTDLCQEPGKNPKYLNCNQHPCLPKFSRDPCPTGYVIDEYCVHDNTYHTCKKKDDDGDDDGDDDEPCPNLGTYTECPAGYVCEFEECSGKYYIIGCAQGYVDMDKFWCDSALRCFIPYVKPTNGSGYTTVGGGSFQATQQSTISNH